MTSLEAVAPRLPPELSDLALVMAGFRSVDAGKLEEQVGKLERARPGPTGRSTSASSSCRPSPPPRRATSSGRSELWTDITKDSAAPQGAQQRAQAMLNYYGPGEGK